MKKERKRTKDGRGAAFMALSALLAVVVGLALPASGADKFPSNPIKLVITHADLTFGRQGRGRRAGRGRGRRGARDEQDENHHDGQTTMSAHVLCLLVQSLRPHRFSKPVRSGILSPDKEQARLLQRSKRAWR